MWLNQLLQIPGVSYPIAKAITNEYPTAYSLIQVYQSEGLTEATKMALLENLVRVGPSSSSKRIGPSISQKIYRLFTEEDGSKLFSDC